MITERKVSQSFINLGVVLNSKGKVLLIKRKKPEEIEKGEILIWAFPGGKQYFGESRKECAEREVFLETGIKIRQLKEISLRVYKAKNIVTLVYHLCKPERSEKFKTQQPWEIEELRWVKPQEIRDLITSNLDEKVAKELKI